MISKSYIHVKHKIIAFFCVKSLGNSLTGFLVRYIKLPMKRRDFLLSTLATSSIALIPGWARANRTFSPDFSPLIDSDIAPLQHLTSFSGSSEIEGDVYDEAHEIFWDKEGYIKKKGGIPAPSAQYDVIIIGGGLAGLSSAYYLRNKKILLLDGQARLGGNAKAQVYRQSFISQGSAYITMPERGGEIDRFLASLNLKNKFREVSHQDEVVSLGGKTIQNFWDGTSSPNRAEEFRRAREKFKDIFENRYPELPIWNPSSSARAYFNSLDAVSFASWAERELGTSHPHVHEFINLYCWSSFAGGAHEISAAQGLNFLAADLNGTLVLPGGNGMIAQALYENLKRRSDVKMLANSFAADVIAEGGKVSVCYRSSANRLETATAKECIVASPKFVMRHVIRNLSRAQDKAMEDVQFRAYLVANIFLKKKVPSPGYDLFVMSGKIPQSPYEETKQRPVTDVIFADWAGKDSAPQSVLTLYLPLPYPMANQLLFAPGLYDKYRDRVRSQLQPILAGMNLSWSDVQGMRLVRTGHAVPLAQIGGVSSGLFETASKSIDGCIHFANQDNWGNPCFETSLGSALSAVKKI